MAETFEEHLVELHSGGKSCPAPKIIELEEEEQPVIKIPERTTPNSWDEVLERGLHR